MKLYLPQKKIVKNGFHLAGIIPVTQEAFEFGNYWPDCLTKVDGKHTFVEYAIYKALCMGCDSIWVSMERKGYTLVRKHVGEYAKSAMKGFVPREGYVRKRIPIYYWFRSAPSDRKYRYMSEITKTIEMSRRLTGKMSNHLAPDRFYVSFPGCIVDIDEIVSFRQNNKKKTMPKVLFQNNDETFKNNRLLDFVCDRKDQNYFDEKLNKENVGFILQEEAEDTKRDFDIIAKDALKEESVEYFNPSKIKEVTDWSSYRDYLSSNIELNFPEWELVNGDFKHRKLYHED